MVEDSLKMDLELKHMACRACTVTEDQNQLPGKMLPAQKGQVESPVEPETKLKTVVSHRFSLFFLDFSSVFLGPEELPMPGPRIVAAVEMAKGCQLQPRRRHHPHVALTHLA